MHWPLSHWLIHSLYNHTMSCWWCDGSMAPKVHHTFLHSTEFSTQMGIMVLYNDHALCLHFVGVNRWWQLGWGNPRRWVWSMMTSCTGLHKSKIHWSILFFYGKICRYKMIQFYCLLTRANKSKRRRSRFDSHLQAINRSIHGVERLF